MINNQVILNQMNSDSITVKTEVSPYYLYCLYGLSFFTQNQNMVISLSLYLYSLWCVFYGYSVPEP